MKVPRIAKTRIANPQTSQKWGLRSDFFSFKISKKNMVFMHLLISVYNINYNLCSEKVNKSYKKWVKWVVIFHKKNFQFWSGLHLIE